MLYENHFLRNRRISGYIEIIKIINLLTIFLKNNFLKLILIFFLKTQQTQQTQQIQNNQNIKIRFYIPVYVYRKLTNSNKNPFLKQKLLSNPNFLTFTKPVQKGFFFINRFILVFMEHFFKKKILLNLKKGSSRLLLRQISTALFLNRFFRKNLNVSKQIVGVLYYSMLLKDSSIFTNFFKKIFEKINIKLHKKLLLGLKKIIKDLFLPVFYSVGLLGVFLNIKGKLGVSGNAKKRRYYFYYGQHSITKKTLKVSHTQTYVWTYTGSLGFGFYLFF